MKQFSQNNVFLGDSLSRKLAYTLANSAVTDEMLQNAASHLSLHCISMYSDQERVKDIYLLLTKHVQGTS